MASFRVAVEPPERVSVAGTEVYACGLWCQGPTLLQALRLLDLGALAAHGHNSAEALHMMAEALKLAFADRERWIGDPRFVDVPTTALLADDYIARRRVLIRAHEAWHARRWATRARASRRIPGRRRLLRPGRRKPRTTPPTSAPSTPRATSSRRRRATSPSTPR